MLTRSPRSRLIEIKLIPLASEEVTAEVSLAFNKRVTQGRDQGPADELSRLRMVANATLSAIEQLSAGRLRCRFIELNRVRAFGRELILMLVAAELGEEQMQLLGKCYVTAGLEEATARAALDATNRTFAYAIEQSSNQPQL
jgi:hypothetical protein